MSVYNLGSINVDHLYRLGHLPRPGETISSTGYCKGLGGKGANQSVAARKAGAGVVHIGAVGADDSWVIAQLEALGIETSHIARLADQPSGHAIVAVDDGAENLIIIHPGANRAQPLAALEAVLEQAGPGDTLLLQNETSLQIEAASLARARGMKVFYSAAPFELAPLEAVLPHVTHLLMNEGEAEALAAATGLRPEALPVEAVIVTMGAAGAQWITPGGAAPRLVPALKVEAVDTTGAGDCFAGSLASRLDQGDSPEAAMRYAIAAAGLQVSRPGAATAMPDFAEVQAILAG